MPTHLIISVSLTFLFNKNHLFSSTIEIVHEHARTQCIKHTLANNLMQCSQEKLNWMNYRWEMNASRVCIQFPLLMLNSMLKQTRQRNIFSSKIAVLIFNGNFIVGLCVRVCASVRFAFLFVLFVLRFLLNSKKSIVDSIRISLFPL